MALLMIFFLLQAPSKVEKKRRRLLLFRTVKFKGNGAITTKGGLMIKDTIEAAFRKYLISCYCQYIIYRLNVFSF